MTTAELPQTETPARPKTLGLPFDTLLLVVVGALVAFGLMMVYSTTFDWSYQEFRNPNTIFLRQLQWLGVGAAAMLVTARVRYHWWRRVAVLLLVGTLIALIGVLLFGSNAFGAQRSFFRGSVQPSELAKFVTIVYLAVWLDSKGDKIRAMGYGIVPFGVIVGLMAGMILLQPDLSAAATIVIVATLMFFVAGADLVQLALVGVLGTFTAWAVLQVSETGRQRLADYIAGLQDIKEASWHVQQAAIAFVNGGWFGRGLGESRQKFFALPTPHTDSIFAVIGEELGLIGCVFVIALFVALVYRGFKIAAQARDPLGALLASGIVCWVGLEALINVAVMVGAMPFAGNALPFISYGGSNLVMMLAAMGVLISISRRDVSDRPTRKTRSAGLQREDSRWSAMQKVVRYAADDIGGRNGRGRVSRTGRR